MARSVHRCLREHATRQFISDLLERRQLLAAIFWDGGGGNFLWTNANNWSTNTLPTAADDVTIDLPSAITVTLSSGTHSINSLTCAEGLTFSGGSLTIAAASTISGTFTLSGASTVLTGAGNLNLTGPSNWTTGAMSGTGTTFIRNGSTLTLGNSTVNVARPLTIDAGGLLDCPSGPLIRLNNVTLTNSGTIRHTGTASASYSSDTASTSHAVVNLGSFVHHSTGTCNFLSAPFTQSGTMTVSAGLVKFQQALAQNATIQVDAPGTVEFRGAYTRDPAAKFVGSGSVTLMSGTHVIDDTWYQITGTTSFSGGAAATVNKPLNLAPLMSGAPLTFNVPVSVTDAGVYGTVVFNQPVTLNGSPKLVGNVTFNSTTTTTFGTLQIGDTFQTGGTTTFSNAAPMTISTLNLWGTLSTPAPVTVNSAMSIIGPSGLTGGGGLFTISSGATAVASTNNSEIAVAKDIRNLGTLNITASADFNFDGATFINDGTVNFSGSSGDFNHTSGSNLLVNNATINKTTSNTSAIFVPLTNNATVAVNGGTLTLAAPSSLFTNNASVTLATGTTLRLGSSIFAAGTVSGGGTVGFVTGTTTIPPGRITTTADLTFLGATVIVDTPLTFNSAASLNAGVATGGITFNQPVTFNSTFSGQGSSIVFNDVVTFSGSVTSFGAITFNTPSVTISSLSIGNTTLGGSATVLVTGTFTALSSSARIGAGTTLHLGPAATASFNSPTLTVVGTLRNQGTVSIAGNVWLSLDGGLFQNEGVVQITTPSGTVRLDGTVGKTNRINNSGTLRKAGNSTLNVTANVLLDNAGTIDLDAGTLTMSAAFSSGSTLVGTWDLASTATFATSVTTNAGTLILGAGAANLTGLTSLANNSGTLDLRGGYDFAVTSATFSNRGTITLSADSVLTVNGNFQNAGTGTPTIASEVIGPADTQVGRVLVIGSNNLSNLNGGASRLQINLGGGYDPVAGTRFNVMSAASVAGSFTQTLGGPTPSGLGFTSGKTATQAYAEVTGTAPAPAVLSSAFDHLTREALLFSFNQNVSASLTRSDFTIINTTTGQTLPNSIGTLGYNTGNNTATITLTGQLANGNYTATLQPVDFANAAGTPGSGAPTVVSFHVLAGDTNRDKKVDFDDLLVLAQNYGATSGRTYASGDLDYDGGVDFDDLLKLAQNYGRTLSVEATTTTRRKPLRENDHDVVIR